MFQLLYPIAAAIQPYLVPICAIFAWFITIAAIWSSYRALITGSARIKRLHQIPCAGCQFFTGDYRLKCTVRPSIALTEDGINCPDFTPRTTPFI